MSFSVSQLELIAAHARAQVTVPGGRSEGTAPWDAVLAEAEAQLAAAPSPRVLVFRLELPIEPVVVRWSRKGKPTRAPLASTMNEYASMPGWLRAVVRRAVDERIALLRPSWARWHCGVKVTHQVVKGKVRASRVPGTGRRRLVRVTRFSSRRPDELSVDCLAGKLPVDRLVHAEILVGDSARWLEREAAWEPCAPGEGRVVIEVYDLVIAPGDVPRAPT